jgi:hypothetical protein
MVKRDESVFADMKLFTIDSLARRREQKELA